MKVLAFILHWLFTVAFYVVSAPPWIPVYALAGFAYVATWAEAALKNGADA